RLLPMQTRGRPSTSGQRWRPPRSRPSAATTSRSERRSSRYWSASAGRRARRPSASGEGCFALLGEGGQALLRVLAAEEAAELVRLVREVLDVVALERVVERALGGRERERAL